MRSIQRTTIFLVLTVLFAMLRFSACQAQQNGAFREVYTGISGNAISDLTNSPSFPGSPAFAEVVTNYFEAPTNADDNYGQRMRALLVPPITGDYTFWIASDDNSTLYLSTDAAPANKQQIAYEPGWTNSRAWNTHATQQSTPISLVAGQQYYIEALQKEGGGGDNLAVTWQKPGDSVPADGSNPIPVSYLIPYGLGAPQIAQQPANTTAVENGTAAFSLTLTNSFAMTYQWQKNGINLPNANGASLIVSPVALGDNGSGFDCVVSNAYGSTNSAVALLSVSPDVTPPVISRLINASQVSVQITFSESVDSASATTLANYSLSGGISITSAAMGADSQTVVLNTGALTYGSNYVLTVNNVRDRAATPNSIASNTLAGFTALPYSPLDVGNAALAGSVNAATNGFDVAGAGSNIGSASDQFQFSYQQRTGNFDVRVQVAGLDPVNAWTKAGLMARASLSAGSVFASVVTTPSLAGSFLEYRTADGGTAALSAAVPANPPGAWLRLQRNGSTFTGYVSYDGLTWTTLGATSISMPGTVFFGMAVTSHDATQLATAKFRTLSDVTAAAVGTVTSPNETPGPSSRKTGLVISEIMYKPAIRTDARNLEFIELFNTNPYFDDISGYHLAGSDVAYTFPPGTVLPGGGFVVVAAVPADVKAVYGVTNVLGPYAGSLKKTGDIQLINDTGAVYLDVPYSNVSPWPVGADAVGHSIVLARPSYGEGDPNAWALSDVVGGSPGTLDTYHPSALRSVMINEFLAHTDPPLFDFIELYNHSGQAVDVSGCILTDDAVTNKFMIPAGTVIPARGFVSFDENQMGFRLDAVGETIYFKNPDASRVLDAVAFEGQENGVSMGRYPDGGGQFYSLTARTPGAANNAILVRDIVINEIMYKPISGNDDDQYVELYNKGTNTVNLSGWQFVAGISFIFPTNTTMAPDSYLVIAKNATNLFAHYPNLNANNTLGSFGGKLSGGGERLALAFFDPVVNTNTPGVTKTNIAWIVEDEVTYGVGGRWGQWAHGGGSSLELLDSHTNHRLAYNWGDSDETTKSAWTNIEHTGVLDLGANYESGIIHFQIGQLDVGESLVDAIEVRPGTAGANYVTNPDFESGLTGWTLEGDHIRSSVESSGYASAHSLHLRCSDRIWLGANSVMGTLSPTTLAAGQTATLRFKARWLRGAPDVLLRLNGNWLEAAGTMPIPVNLGTPGARNSRAAGNAGPAIYEVTHTPPLPAANQNVVVTARVHDPDGLQSVSLKYRIDPSTSYSTVAMTDDGTGGDAIAGDGIYSATISGRSAGTVIAFLIQTSDSLSATTQFPAVRADNAPVREGVIYFGDTTPLSAYGSYHLWLTQTNITRWSNLPDLSNESMDGTFVNGSRVIYNVGARYAGSPYHQSFNGPTNNPTHYRLEMPDDDEFLGATSFNKIHAPGNGPFDDDTLQREQTFYWMVRQLKLPWNYRRYVAMYINGQRRGTLMEDTQVPDSDVVDEHFPSDTGGDLFKLQPWFEFDAAGNSFNNESWCTLNNFTTTGGVKKLARYRWNYLSRRNPYGPNNYTNVYNLVNAANNTANTPTFISAMEREADMEEWMRTFAASHSVGDWDHVGTQNAQNMYAYKPTQGKWTLLLWDCNILLGNGSWTPGQNLFSYTGGDSGMANIYNTPAYTRGIWRAYKEIASNIMDPARVNPILDAKYATFQAEGINVARPAGAVEPWIASARASILSQVASANGNAPFSISGSANFSTNKNQLTLTGVAPFEVKTIAVNGVPYPVTWTTVTGWSLNLALSPGVNNLTISGYDLQGNAVANATKTMSINYTGTAETPQGHVVINEIMYNPLVSDASFIELYNSSTVNAFDLSGFRLEGADFIFPGGSLIKPGGFLVVAGDANGFAAAYGSQIALAGTFNGKLSNGGETLKLVKPGLTPAQDLIINEVTYSGLSPWPALANGFGPSLQLIDPAQDNGRVANWTAAATNTGVAPPQWQFATLTGTATTSRLYVYLQAAGDVYLDDIQIVAGSIPGSGSNVVNNGGFETALTGPWNVTANCINSSISTAFAHSGNSSLHLVCTAGGTTQSDSIWQDMGPLTTNATYTLSYWYLPNTNGGTVTLRLSGSGINSAQSIAAPAGVSTSQYTPGAANSVRKTLASFPTLWLNEVQPNNLTGIADHLGHHHPWVELYNSGASAVNLAGYYLANNYTNLTQWAFPDIVVNPKQFLVVYADGNPGESIGAELHTSFTLPPLSGSVALVTSINSQIAVLDYLNYSLINADRSYGAFPDGTPALRQKFFFGTPGATNNSTYPVAPVFINEWMAKNNHTITDPADGKFGDWFELYNDGPSDVDLAGYVLSDNLTNKTKFTIPIGYMLPAGQFLLVWADNNSSHNSTNDPSLHANFKLSASGGSIAFFTPNGNTIDSVTYGAQTNDISQGRWPNGSTGPFRFMTTATPGFANTIGGTNSAPVLAAISNQTVNEGSLLTVAASASDPDPGDTLTFSLDPGAPSGTLINSGSGVFTWTPTEAQGPGVYSVTVRVTDAGSPPLSDSKTFTVTVNEVNTPPVLDPISDHSVSVGVSLAFVVTASDADIPAQTLGFTLGTGAPAGAGINPATGVFSWTPTASQSPSTNVITVRVTDSGTPLLSDSKTFTVVVAAATQIQFTAINLSAGGVINLAWTSQTGVGYRLEYKNDLNEATWTTLNDFTATGNTTNASDTVNPSANRYYRIEQLH